MSNRYIAKELAKKYGVKVKHERYREDGKWYHPLKNFPAAFFDKNGYIIFNTKEDYFSCDYLRLGQDVNIPGDGISSIPGYIYFTDLSKNNTNSAVTTEKANTKVPPDYSNLKLTEGAIREITTEIKSRNIQVKQAAVKKYGAVCQVCGFVFAEKYGELGKDFIEIHHINPLSESFGERNVTVDDVNLVCANCHRMLHRNGAKGILVEVLRDIIKQKDGIEC